MNNRSMSTIFLRSLWIIGILILFCDLASYQEPANVPVRLTLYDNTGNTTYIQAPKQSYGLGLNVSLRYKKVTAHFQQYLCSAKQYLIFGWNKTLQRLTGSNLVFDSRFQPAFLFLDKPPPSNSI